MRAWGPALLIVAGCLPDIRGKLYEPFDTAAAAAAGDVIVEDDGGGVLRLIVNATSATDWVYVDLEAEGLEVEDAASGWDIAMSRQRVMLNGGVSGTEGVEVSVVEAGAVEEVTAAPTDGFVTDLADDDDENAEPEYAFDVWFDYDSETHVLTPKPLVFVVRSTEGRLWPIEIVEYYDDAGTSGYLQLRIGPEL